MIDFQPHAQGVVVPVRAQAGARRNAVRGVHVGRLKVSVTQAPEKGKANKALIAVLAEALGVSKSQVTLLSGETDADKKFLVRGIARDELTRRIAAVIAAQ